MENNRHCKDFWPDSQQTCRYIGETQRLEVQPRVIVLRYGRARSSIAFVRSITLESYSESRNFKYPSLQLIPHLRSVSFLSKRKSSTAYRKRLTDLSNLSRSVIIATLVADAFVWTPSGTLRYCRQWNRITTIWLRCDADNANGSQNLRSAFTMLHPGAALSRNWNEIAGCTEFHIITCLTWRKKLLKGYLSQLTGCNVEMYSTRSAIY